MLPAETERRSKLSDDERKAEDRALGKDKPEDKAKWNFMQKYYHKGAYFQDEDETGNSKLGPVMQQDFGSATGKDSFMDKSSMPEIMQVKNFGFRSQARRE